MDLASPPTVVVSLSATTRGTDMTGYLVQVSKARNRKKGSGAQARNAAKVPREGLEHVPHVNQTRIPANSPVLMQPPFEPPHAPRKVGGLKPLVIGGGLLAAGGGGAYLYQRKRAEKSLSSMQRDSPSMMMRST